MKRNSQVREFHQTGSLERALFGVAILIAAVAAYFPALRADFVTYDDGLYVTENSTVQSGLNAESIVYAFTTGKSGSWQPLTWLSHMLDCAVFGMAPWGHHLTNMVLHGLNSVLLFLVLCRMTRSPFASLFVSSVFALHPMHVESVAWISERKDVLSTFFAMLTLWAYASYCERPSRWRYTMTLVWLALGLLAKPMLVTIPCVLLLLDYWPLGRFNPVSVKRAGRLALEKSPHFALAILFSALTLWTQRGASAMSSLEALPLGMRAKNALYSYLVYIGKSLWPTGLAAYYPHPRETLSSVEVGAAVLVLLAVTAVAIYLWRRSPYLPVGWFWYLGTLVPVIGIVQVGTQGMADRYMYFPLVGLAIMVAWGVPQLAGTLLRTSKAKTIRVIGVVTLALLAWRTWVQAGYWKDSETLFRHALAVTENNEIAEHGAAKALLEQERFDEALPYLDRAVALNPRNPESLYHLGVVYQNLGRTDAAMAQYTLATEVDPAYSRAYNNLGVLLLGAGRLQEAEQAIAKAVETDPQNREALENYGGALVAVGKYAEAEAHLRPLLRESPDDAFLHNNLAVALAAQGKYEDARAHYETALRLRPGHPEAMRGLAVLPAP
jgi:Flp pilus assembly protein TadD